MESSKETLWRVLCAAILRSKLRNVNQRLNLEVVVKLLVYPRSSRASLPSMQKTSRALGVPK